MISIIAIQYSHIIYINCKNVFFDSYRHEAVVGTGSRECSKIMETILEWYDD